MRRTFLFAAVAVLAAACSTGGGATDSVDQASTDAATAVKSDDGKAVLTVPRGVDPSGITLTRADPPVELSGFDGYVVAYDLQPSGLEFPEPPTLSVTVPASAFDVGEGVPLVGAAVLDGETAEAVAATTERAGDDILVEVEVPHFSLVVVGGGLGFSASVEPPRAEIAVGESFEASWTMTLGRRTGVVFSSKSNPSAYLRRFDPLSSAPFEYVGEDPVKGPHRWSCSTPTSGPVPDAYGWLLVFDGLEHQDDPLTKFAEALSADEPKFWAARVTGEASCLDPEGEDAGGESPTYVYVIGDVEDDWLVAGATPLELGRGPAEVNVVGFGCSEDGECALDTAGDPVSRCEADDVDSCASRLFLETDGGRFFVECPFGANEAEVSGPDGLGEVRCDWSEDGITFTFLAGLPQGSRILGSVQFDPTTDGEATGVYDGTGYLQVGSGPLGPPPSEDGPVVGSFTDTDGACGFDDFTDNSYVARVVREGDSYRIELEQGSTGDVGAFSATEDGIVFESDTGESYEDIEVVGDALEARYSYTSDGCTQAWRARLIFRPGYLEYLGTSGN